MSRFRQLSHTIWHCQYHIVWVPKYRFRILSGLVGQEVERCIRAFSERLGAEIIELNVQVDHVHLLVMVPPKISISEFVGTLKGRTAIRVFNKFRHLKHKPYWGNHFRARVIVSTPWVSTRRRFESTSNTRKRGKNGTAPEPQGSGTTDRALPPPGGKAI